MDVYQTEQDQVEAIKKWWKENGRSIIAGLVLGLGGVFGWRYWQDHQETRAAQASIRYQFLLELAAANTPDRARAHGDSLIQDFPGSTYAALAALTLARVAVEQGDLDEARRQLQWVLDRAKLPELRSLAQLRLARIALAQGELDRALELTQQVSSVGLAGLLAELRGDIALARGDLPGARDAYLQALGLTASATDRAVIEMKLSALGVVAGSAAGTEVGP